MIDNQFGASSVGRFSIATERGAETSEQWKIACGAATSAQSLQVTECMYS